MRLVSVEGVLAPCLIVTCIANMLTLDEGLVSHVRWLVFWNSLLEFVGTESGA